MNIEPCDATFLTCLEGGWQRRLTEVEYNRLLAIAKRANLSLAEALFAMKAEWKREQRTTPALGSDPDLATRAGKVSQRIGAAEVLLDALINPGEIEIDVSTNEPRTDITTDWECLWCSHDTFKRGYCCKCGARKLESE